MTRDDGLREALDAHFPFGIPRTARIRCLCGDHLMSWSEWSDHREAAVRIALAAPPPAPPAWPQGARLIAEERLRQIDQEGYTADHDDDLGHWAELPAAAAAYAVADDDPEAAFEMWPWERQWWKPKDRLRNFVRAGALIAAAIDAEQRRLAALAAPEPSE